MRVLGSGRLTVLLVLFVVSLLAPTIGTAQCVSARYNPSFANSIGVIQGTGWAPAGGAGVSLSGIPAAAISKWQGGCTDATGASAMGSNYPNLLDGSHGDFDVTVDKLLGPIPTPPNGQTAGCAQFAPKLDSTRHVIGGSIQFFDKDAQGQPCDSSYSMYFADILAHELGHVLGLDDTSCSGYIMGPSAYTGIGPNAGECAQVNNQWTTSKETPPAPAPPAPGPRNTDPVPTDPPVIKTCGTCSPIVINFSADDYALTGAASPVLFDIGAVGMLSSIGWTAAGANEAFLWLDRNGDGLPDNGWELFGSVTPLRNGSPAGNGFIALAEYDDNHDGMIDDRDLIWTKLRLWRDLNHDGIAQAGEIAPIAGSGVTAIDLHYHWTGRHDQFGNLFGFKSKVWIMDPSGRATSRPLYDIVFVPVNQP